MNHLILYQIFNGDNCTFLRGKPKIYLLNKYEVTDKDAIFGKFKKYKDGLKHYHPDGDVLIVNNKYFVNDFPKLDGKSSSFVDILNDIISNSVTNDTNLDIKHLREIILDIRNTIDQESKGICIEMVDTMAGPVKFIKNNDQQ